MKKILSYPYLGIILVIGGTFVILNLLLVLGVPAQDVLTAGIVVPVALAVLYEKCRPRSP